MKFQSLEVDDLVLSAQKPSRYVGGEVNSIVKDLRAMRATWALCFPDTYEVGMSNVGFRLLYNVLNQCPDVACERAFMPWPDMVAMQRERGIPLWSMESRAPLADFDILGFSLQFETAYTTCLEMLDLAGIPVFANERTEQHPLVIAGGPCTYNGEPVAPFFDAMTIGEGEEVVHEITDAFVAWRASGSPRTELLERLARIPGVYVPSFFEVRYAEDGTIAAVVPTLPGYERVQRRVIPDLNLVPQPERPILPFMQAVHDRLPLEIQRGCTRGCRFCQVGMLTRPTRQRDPRQVLELASKGLMNTGYEEVGFLSLSAGDYECINPLLEDFFERFAAERIAISLPSLRTETMNDRLADQIGRVKKTGFTIAPEAATDRLRRVINKGNSEENLLRAVESVFRAGWSIIKLYFMIGLPTETDEDVLAIAALARKALRAVRTIRPDAQLTVSVSTFVPKPMTPFQWERMDTLEETIRKHNLLRQTFQRRGPLTLKYHEAGTSLVEGALARGDRRVATAIHAAWKSGQVLDSWTEHFKAFRWDQAFAEMERVHHVGRDFMLRERRESEVLPWDHIDSGVQKSYLLRERTRSRAEVTVPDCATGACSACGACDFDVVTTRVYREKEYRPQETSIEPPPAMSDAGAAAEAAGVEARTEARSEGVGGGAVGDQVRSGLGTEAVADEKGAEPVGAEFRSEAVGDGAVGAEAETGPGTEAVAVAAENGAGAVGGEATAAQGEAGLAGVPAGAEVRRVKGPARQPERHFLRFRYSKTGRSIAVSHLETMTLLMRALRRSRLPVSFTQGFSPHPRIAFGPACPVGVETLAEFFDVQFAVALDPAMALEALGREMPMDFAILSAEMVSSKAAALNSVLVAMHYLASFPTEVDPAALARGIEVFRAAETVEVQREKPSKSRGGGPGPTKTVNVRAAVLALEQTAPREVRFRLKAGNDASAKPSEVISAIFGPVTGVRLLKEDATLAQG